MKPTTTMLLFVICGLLLAACGEEEVTEPTGPPPGLLDPSQAVETAPAVFKAQFECSNGTFVIECHREWAPRGADRFYNLVKCGFYDECRFFRVMKNFVVQWGVNGDPLVSKNWRTARIPDDPRGPETPSNTTGYVTFATSGADSRTTQLFINYKDQNRSLDRSGFIVFGKVVQGMDVVNGIEGKYQQQPQQPSIQTQGNTYLKSTFPDLDYIKKARLLD